MNDKLLCPFCNKPLQPTHRIEDEYFCENYDCPQTSLTWVGTSSLWKAFADTKKKLDDLSDKNGKLKSKLDIAVDALKDIRCVYTGDQTTKPSTMFGRAAGALNKITALEQKDVK